MYTRSKSALHSNGSGYQPFSGQSHTDNNGAGNFDSRLTGITNVLDTMGDMLQKIEADTVFEKSVLSYLNLLHSMVKDMKIEQAQLRDEMLVRNSNVRDSVDDLTLSVVKTEQYSRRDTVTVVGLPVENIDAESQSDLTSKVARQLSLSGESVAPSDLTAVHRNSRQIKDIRGKKIPPSVTVRFANINKKDNTLRGYKNYDVSQGKPRDVKVYQSLTSHYTTVRGTMYDFLNSKPEDGKDFGKIVNNGLKVKWITYQSPTSGFAVKLQTGEYFNRIHVWSDFVNTIWDKFPACRATS